MGPAVVGAPCLGAAAGRGRSASPRRSPAKTTSTSSRRISCPTCLRDLADIISGRRRDWLPPDDIFIRSLESHLDWPVQLASAYILEHADKSKAFDLRVQRWMTRSGLDLRPHAARRMGQGRGQHGQDLAYVWANRLIFYKALRARFPDLPRLELRPSVKKPDEALAAFNALLPEGRGAERRL